MTDTEELSKKLSWDDEKREFAKKAFAQSIHFMEMDNEIIHHFSIITGALSGYIKENPGELLKLSNNTEGLKVLSGDSVLTGRGLGGDLLDLIKEIILKDKEFILNLIKDLLKL